MKAKKFVYCKAFEGEPTLENFRLEEEDLLELKPGEVLFEALCYSVDPYMRVFMSDSAVGTTMIGSQVAVVTKTKNGCYPLGTRIVGYFGWRTHTIINPDDERPLSELLKPMPIHDLGRLPISLALGATGMPGNTAYFGFWKACEAKEGQVVAVSGAGGAVGSIVGQLAKMKGCKVVAFTGSEEKKQWLLEELGFDFVFNYKTCGSMSEALESAVPQGIDQFFDGVGGDISNTVIQHMNPGGTVLITGSISTYNQPTPSPNTNTKSIIKSRNIKEIEFRVMEHADSWEEGIHSLIQWIKEGKIKYRETVLKGFEKLPEAFLGMMKGENIGKMVIYA